MSYFYLYSLNRNAIVASYITPVPGGVGPMTVAMLLRNTLDQAIKVRVKVRLIVVGGVTHCLGKCTSSRR